jgi:glycosyltransferase involved in cell wall biosynthesis
MTRPFRVTYIGHVARYSGMEIGLARFIAATDQVEATVILAEDGPLVQPLEEAGARVEVLPLAEHARGLKKEDVRPGRAQAAAAAEVARYVRRLRGRLRQLRPDIVHTHSLKAGVYGGLAARLAGIPAVWHLQDRLSPDYLPKPAVVPMRFLASTLPSALLVPSRHTLATVGRHFRPGLRVAIIPFPVPLPEEPVEVRDEVHEVGMVGRLAPWKGQDVFLDAFARAFPDNSVRARIVGSAIFGEKFYEDQLHAQADALGIRDRVDFIGFTPEVDAELRRLDLLVHASVTADPLATVVLEGMAAGLPVISADDGGHAEHVENGREGLLFAPGNADSLADALRRAAADRDLRVRISEGGRAKAREFGPEPVVERMLALYRDLAGHRLSRG